MKIKLTLLIGAIVLAGCASTKVIYCPLDGQPSYQTDKETLVKTNYFSFNLITNQVPVVFRGECSSWQCPEGHIFTIIQGK
ncbi:MAG: hypothetical protein AABY22_15935 [Nanoarchaeota archaeon]